MQKAVTVIKSTEKPKYVAGKTSNQHTSMLYLSQKT